MSISVSSDNSHVFERLYTQAFKIFMAEVCLKDEQLDELKKMTGDFIDKQTGKTFYELGKLIIEINLDTDNNTIDLDKFKFAKHKFMKSQGFQRSIMEYYQKKNYVAVVKPSSPQSMIAKIILYYKPEKPTYLSTLISDVNENELTINTDNLKKTNIFTLDDVETDIGSDCEKLTDFESDTE